MEWSPLRTRNHLIFVTILVGWICNFRKRTQRIKRQRNFGRWIQWQEQWRLQLCILMEISVAHHRRLTAFDLLSSRSSSLLLVELCLVDDRTFEASAAVEYCANYVHAHSLINVSGLCDLICQQAKHAGTKSKKGTNTVQRTIGVANILSGGVHSIAWAEGSVDRVYK